MNKNVIMAVIIGLVIGAGGTIGISAATKDSRTSKVITVPASDHNAQAAAKLKNLKGDEFDKAFMEEMIAHHQSAIDMAKLVDSNAKHDELKKLGTDILSAQSKEIDMMQSWQGDWGYKNVPKSHSDSMEMGH